MIHVRTWGPGDENAPEDRTIQFTVTGQSLSQFQTILQRALNTAPPEKEEYKDWYELTDKLEELLRSSPSN